MYTDKLSSSLFTTAWVTFWKSQRTMDRMDSWLLADRVHCHRKSSAWDYEPDIKP